MSLSWYLPSQIQNDVVVYSLSYVWLFCEPKDYSPPGSSVHGIFLVKKTNIWWIIEKAREFQRNIYFCFIDYAKAIDCVDHSKLWQILKEMGIADHLTCLLRNLYAGQEATVITSYGKMDWLQIGKAVPQGCISSPCLFNLYAEYIMGNVGLDEA